MAERPTETTSEVRDPEEAPVRPSEDAQAPALEAIQERIVEQLEAASPAEAAIELAELHPPDQAEIIAELPEEARAALLGSLTEEAIADILEHMEPDDAVELSGLIDVRRMAEVLDRTPPDVAADVLRGLDWQHAGQVLVRMKDRQLVGDLLLYKDDDAGGLMSPEIVALRDAWLVPRAINVLRNSGLEPEDMRQLFVVDRDGVLQGRLDLAELVFAPPTARVRDVMHTDVMSVDTETDQEEVARIMSRYDLRSLPVTEKGGRLVGAIAIEDVIDVAEQEATEDMLRMVGVRGEDRARGPVLESVRNRLPWLIANIATVVLVASILNLFESTLDQIAVLAVYMPMVMNQAGIAGTQVVTVIVRSMALNQVSARDTVRLLARESVLALLNGLVVSVILAAIVGLWRQDVNLGLIIFAAMQGSYFVAAAAGVLIPMTMKRFRIDPATASGVVLTTVTDIAGGASYLALATLFISTLRGG